MRSINELLILLREEVNNTTTGCMFVGIVRLWGKEKDGINCNEANKLQDYLLLNCLYDTWKEVNLAQLNEHIELTK